MNELEPTAYQERLDAQTELEKLERSLELEGYNLDQLDRDNPYNQWMYE